jgi:hypothetical protein
MVIALIAVIAILSPRNPDSGSWQITSATYKVYAGDALQNMPLRSTSAIHC